MKENLIDGKYSEHRKLLKMDDEEENEIANFGSKKSIQFTSVIGINDEGEEDDYDENFNIDFTQQVNSKKKNSLFADFKNSSRNYSVSSIDDFNSNSLKQRSNTVQSKDCVLGLDTVSMELKNEILYFNPDIFIPPLLNSRKKLLASMNYKEILKIEKKELTRPLLKMEGVNDIQTALQIFRNLLSYMKMRSSSKKNPILHAKKILKLVKLSSPILKDEAYLQVYKQLNGNHDPQKFIDALKMLGILASCFAPDNKNIYLLVLQFLYNELKDNQNDMVLRHLKYIFIRMIKTSERDRKNVPCQDELEYIQLLNPIPITVYLFDGKFVNINVESYTSIREVKEKVINNLYLDSQNTMNYCLYEICRKKNVTEERYLDDSERICDILSVWKSEMDKDDKKKIDSVYSLYFRTIIFTPFEKDDTDILTMIYYQNIYDMRMGRFPVNQDQAVVLASLQLFNDYIGDEDDDISIITKDLEENLELYVTKRIIGSLAKEEWVTRIMQKFKILNNLGRAEIQWKYLEELSNVFTYQTTQFDAIYNQKKSSINSDNIPEKCIVALNKDGIHIVDRDYNQIIFYHYENVINWGISKDQFIICMPTDSPIVKRVSFITSQTKVIQNVIEVYCSLKAGKTKKVIKEIIDGYDERFKSIDGTRKNQKLVHKSEGKLAPNFSQLDNKLMNDETARIKDFTSNQEIFKERNTNAIMRINDINSKKDDIKTGILLIEQF